MFLAGCNCFFRPERTLHFADMSFAKEELQNIKNGYTLCSMVKKISVYENHRIEIEFYYTDQYRIMREVNKRIKDEQKKNCVAERSA